MRAAPKRATAPAKAAADRVNPRSNYPVIRDKPLIAKVEEYAKLASTKSLSDARMKELKPEIEAALGDFPTAFVGVHVVSKTEVPDVPSTPNRVVTKEMIGQVIPGEKGRRGYTMLKVQ